MPLQTNQSAQLGKDCRLLRLCRIPGRLSGWRGMAVLICAFLSRPAAKHGGRRGKNARNRGKSDQSEKDGRCGSGMPIVTLPRLSIGPCAKSTQVWLTAHSGGPIWVW